jgi:outer membrane lipoprotein-sorting protein
LIKIFSLIFFVVISNICFASTTTNIIENLLKTNTLTFDFKQKIGDKIESGNCKIKYPKLLYCLYNNDDRKEMVSNGRSLVIKNNRHNKSWIYPLKKTPLEYILDKEFLLSKIESLEPFQINEKFIEFKISDENSSIIIYFDSKTFNLAGWKNKDAYQNEVEFKISNLQKNEIINEKTFKLPRLD